eukprot:GHVU01214254.1.p1 GENE.GHVU01214254.1~~GHVU01214254.1.p1  ORF type:complete len:512 (+),score=78.21 GHVU01214254.1:107-1537(+)
MEKDASTSAAGQPEKEKEEVVSPEKAKPVVAGPEAPDEMKAAMEKDASMSAAGQPEESDVSQTAEDQELDESQNKPSASNPLPTPLERQHLRNLQDQLWEHRAKLKKGRVQTIKSTAKYVWVTTKSLDTVEFIKDAIRGILSDEDLKFVKIKVTDTEIVLQCKCKCNSYGVGSLVICGCNSREHHGTGGGFFCLKPTFSKDPMTAMATCKHVLKCGKEDIIDSRGEGQSSDWVWEKVYVEDDSREEKLAGTEYFSSKHDDIAFVPLLEGEEKTMVDVFQLGPDPNRLPLNYTMELSKGDLTCGKKVQKFGSTTKLTHGRIIAKKEVRPDPNKVHRFDCPGATGGVAEDITNSDESETEDDHENDQRHMFRMVGHNSEHFSQRGDSGSLVTTIPDDGDTIKVLGMVYAGEPGKTPTTSLAFRLDKAFKKLELEKKVNLHILCLKVENDTSAESPVCESSECGRLERMHMVSDVSNVE